jgi:hypothetical protein
MWNNSVKLKHVSHANKMSFDHFGQWMNAIHWIRETAFISENFKTYKSIQVPCPRYYTVLEYSKTII